MTGGHTPGPWEIDPTNGDIVSGPLNIAILYACRPEDKAIMTAGPDLLEALIRVSNEVRLCGYAGETGFEVWLAAADEAIAKATGLPLKSQGDA